MEPLISQLYSMWQGMGTLDTIIYATLPGSLRTMTRRERGGAPGVFKDAGAGNAITAAVAISADETGRGLDCYLTPGVASVESIPTFCAWRSGDHRLLREGWRIVAQTADIERCFRPGHCGSIVGVRNAAPGLIGAKDSFWGHGCSTTRSRYFCSCCRPS